MSTIAVLLSQAEEVLKGSNIPDAGRQAVSLMQFALGRDRAFLIAHPEYELNLREQELFGSVVLRRSRREPLQYIVGKQEFYGLDIVVNPDVLIPRPETEILVERAIEITGTARPNSILEIGIGSGCISIAILKHCPAASGLGVDISDRAIRVAQQNASMHGVDGRLRLLSSDVFSDVGPERFDLIVSNPPYVPKSDLNGLQPEVRDHEPVLALTDGDTGLRIIERIVGGAPEHLKPGGHLLVEIGFGQSEKVREMTETGAWGTVELLADLQGIPRILSARLAETKEH
ncbi:MAG: peptide chain release factor N(5)-glutamine methyltransferase [Pyrinomonadaceae bacterium]